MPSLLRSQAQRRAKRLRRVALCVAFLCNFCYIIGRTKGESSNMILGLQREIGQFFQFHTVDKELTEQLEAANKTVATLEDDKKAPKKKVEEQTKKLEEVAIANTSTTTQSLANQYETLADASDPSFLEETCGCPQSCDVSWSLRAKNATFTGEQPVCGDRILFLQRRYKMKRLDACESAVENGYCSPSCHPQQCAEENAILQLPQTSGRCAINFFGLPRSFESMVLPSMTRNVFRWNARFGCDYFIHYYHREEEGAGRAGQGGALNPNEVLLMKQKILNAANMAKSTPNQNPAVIFVKDTEEEFWQKRGQLVEKYRTTKSSDGNYLYYPWKAKTYRYPESLDNIVKQWHSIQSVWEAMEEYTKLTGRPRYERVAMMRLDVLYALPVDIFKTDNSTMDLENKYSVSPGFAKYPVNDRMFYGPYDAVKIWATERFSRLENHVHSYEPGWGMHSEHFLESGIFSAIEAAGFPMTENPDICVMRVRADLSVWMNDCITRAGTTRGMKQIDRQKLIEKMLGRPCTKSKLRRATMQLHCPLEQTA